MVQRSLSNDHNEESGFLAKTRWAGLQAIFSGMLQRAVVALLVKVVAPCQYAAFPVKHA